MVFQSCKCLICGTSDNLSYSNELNQSNQFQQKYSNVFRVWKSCEQIVRDMGFTWKQIQSFQNQIRDLSAKILNRLDCNYEQIKEKSNPITVQNRISSLVNAAVSIDIPNYSYEEMIEVICSVSSSRQPHHVPNECADSNSVILNSSFPQQIIKNSIETNDIPICGFIDKIKKEEDSEDEHYFPETEQYLPENNLECSLFKEDVPGKHPIKSESPDTNEEDLKRVKRWIGNDKSEDEDLYNESFDENSCSSDSDFDVKKYKKQKMSYRSSLKKQKLAFRSSSKKRKPKKVLEKQTTKLSCPEPNCTKKCISEKNMKIHIQQAHKGEKQPYQCDQCLMRFTIQPHLRRHIRDIHEKGKPIRFNDCSFCGKKYNSAEELASHYSTSHKEPHPFQCAFCPDLYETSTDLKNHTRDTHCEVFKCSFCEKSFMALRTMKDHETRVHKNVEATVPCPECDKKLVSEYALHIHMGRFHRNPKAFKCDLCSEYFATMFQVKLHKGKEHNCGFPCEVCGEVSATIQVYRSHVTRHKHGSSTNTNKNRKNFKPSKPTVTYNYECKFCAKGYNEENEINAHYAEAHLGPNPFTCAFCPEISSNSHDLRKHMEFVHPDPNRIAGKLKCETCGRYFLNKITFKLHSLTHADPNLLFKCHLCPSVYKQRCLLKRHLEDHSGERKYICEKCGKNYKSSWGLYQHAITHDESRRKFKCKLCEKKFFKRSHCQNHERTHTNMKEFVCQICGRGFNMFTNLTQHLKIHAGLPTRGPRKK